MVVLVKLLHLDLCANVFRNGLALKYQRIFKVNHLIENVAIERLGLVGDRNFGFLSSHFFFGKVINYLVVHLPQGYSFVLLDG